MVRKIYVCMILTLSIASLCSAQDINGKWKGKMQGPNGDMEMVFNFKVNADTLNGTAESPMGELPISNGKVKGRNESSWNGRRSNGNYTQTFSRQEVIVTPNQALKLTE